MFTGFMMPLHKRLSIAVKDCSYLSSHIIEHLEGTLLFLFIAQCSARKFILQVSVCSVCSVLFGSVRFCSVLFCSVLFCPVLFCSVRFCSVLFGTVRFGSVLFGSIRFCSVLFG